MVFLWIIGVLLLLILLLGLLRVRAVITVGEEPLRVELRFCTIRRLLYPRRRKRKEAQKPREKEAGAKKRPKKRKSRRQMAEELLEPMDIAISALYAAARRACHRLRIDPLELTVVFGGRDPAETAWAYSAASAAMWTLMPRLEELFYIPDPSLHLGVNFDQENTAIRCRSELSFRLWDVLAILLTVAAPVGWWHLKRRWKERKKNRKRQSAGGGQASAKVDAKVEG